MKRKKKRFVEVHKYKVIGPVDEVYPGTNQKLIRPKINFVEVILKVLFVLLLMGLLDWLILEKCIPAYSEKNDSAGVGMFLLIYLAMSLVCLVIFSKRIVIFVIRLYQRYGPYVVRSRCLFIPNCSEYMVLAIKKYGLIKGIKKGIDRFNRCCDPNGGIDYP